MHETSPAVDDRAHGTPGRLIASLFVAACLLYPPYKSQAQVWSSTGGPSSGQVLSVEVDSEGTLWAGTADKGLFYRTAGSSEWRRISSANLDGTDIRSVVTDQGQTIVATAGRGVFISEGSEFVDFNEGLQSSQVHTLFLSSRGTLFAGTNTGLYRLTSNGWSFIESAIEGRDIRAMTESPDGYLFAGAFGDAVYRSADGGLDWTRLSQGLNSTIIRSMSHRGEFEVYVGTFGGDFIQQSTDRGETWHAAADGLSRGVWALYTTPEGRLLAGTRGDGVFYSDDGVNWSIADAPATTATDFAAGLDGTLYAGTRVGVLKSTDDGLSWTIDGIPFSTVNELHRVGDRIYAGTILSGLHYTDDGGARWVSTDLKTETILDLYEDASGRLLVGTLDGAILIDAGDGSGWKEIFRSARIVHSVVVADDGAIISATESGIYRMDPADSTWARVALANIGVRSLVVDPDAILAGTEFEGVWRSTDDGQTWDAVGGPPSEARGWIWRMIRRPDGQIMVTSTLGQVWVTSDVGASWTLTFDLESAVTDLVAGEDGSVLASTLSGQVFRTIGRPVVWEPVGPRFNQSPTWAIEVLDGKIFVGGDPVGAHRLDGLVITGSETEPQAADFTIDIYPNPIGRDQASLAISVPRTSLVRLTVVDVLGRRINRTELQLGTGSHKHVLSAPELSSGFYVLVAEVDGVSISKPFVVTR